MSVARGSGGSAYASLGEAGVQAGLLPGASGKEGGGSGGGGGGGSGAGRPKVQAVADCDLLNAVLESDDLDDILDMLTAGSEDAPDFCRYIASLALALPPPPPFPPPPLPLCLP